MFSYGVKYCRFNLYTWKYLDIDVDRIWTTHMWNSRNTYKYCAEVAWARYWLWQ